MECLSPFSTIGCALRKLAKVDLFDRGAKSCPRTSCGGNGGNKGFTLVETAIAMGIIAVALLPVSGLLLQGLSVFRSGNDISVGVQIGQMVINDVQQADFSTVVSNVQGTRYFDEWGRVLTSATNAIYHVNVRVSPSPTLPGAPLQNKDLATVTVQIATNPGKLPLTMNSGLWVATEGVNLNTFSTVIAGNN